MTLLARPIENEVQLTIARDEVWLTDKPPFLMHMYVSPNSSANYAQTFDKIE